MGTLTSFLKISLVDDVSRPARTVAQALKDAANSMKNVDKAMGGSGSSMGGAFKKQLASFNLTKKELAQVRLEWMRYAQAQRAALGDDWLKKNAAGVKTWKSQTIAALRAVRSERIAERKAMTAAVGKGGVGGGFVEGLGYGAPGALGLYSGLGPKVVAGAAVAGGAAYGMKKAIDYEKAMVEVRKKVNLPDGVGMKSMEDMVDRTSLKVGLAREEVAGLVAQLGAAGVEYKDMQGMVDLTAKGAVAFDVPARDMAQYLAQIRAQTQGATQDMADFVDKVNMLADTGASSEKDIVEMFSRSAAAAKAANVPLDASLAALTALNSIGMQPEVASRFWNAFTSKLALVGPEKAKDFKELGLSIKDFQSQFKTDSMGAMIKLLEALEKSPNKAGVAQNLFGKEWWDEAARAGQALPEIIKNMKNIANTATWKGSSGSALNMQLETSAAQLERMKSLVSQIGDKMMRWTLPPLNSAIDSMIKQMEGLGRVWDDLKSGKKIGPALMDESNRQLGKVPYKEVFAKYGARDTRPSMMKLGDEALRVGTKKQPAFPKSPLAGDMGSIGGMERREFPTFAVHPKGLEYKGGTIAPRGPAIPPAPAAPQELKLTPTVAPIPPLPPQELKVTPHIDASSFASFLTVMSSATSAFETLNKTVTPHVDSSSIDAVSGKAQSAHGAVSSLNMTATPTVNTGSIDAAIAKVHQLHSLLASAGAQASAVGAAAAGAAAQAARAASAIGSASKVSRANYVAPSVEGRT